MRIPDSTRVCFIFMGVCRIPVDNLLPGEGVFEEKISLSFLTAKVTIIFKYLR